jgi:hypothetical protein
MSPASPALIATCFTPLLPSHQLLLQLKLFSFLIPDTRAHHPAGLFHSRETFRKLITLGGGGGAFGFPSHTQNIGNALGSGNCVALGNPGEGGSSDFREKKTSMITN